MPRCVHTCTPMYTNVLSSIRHPVSAITRNAHWTVSLGPLSSRDDYSFIHCGWMDGWTDGWIDSAQHHNRSVNIPGHHRLDENLLFSLLSIGRKKEKNPSIRPSIHPSTHPPEAMQANFRLFPFGIWHIYMCMCTCSYSGSTCTPHTAEYVHVKGSYKFYPEPVKRQKGKEEKISLTPAQQPVSKSGRIFNTFR